MNIKTRLAKIENSIDPNVCPTCGNKRPTPVSREQAEQSLASLLPLYNTRQEAIEALGSVDPECARALGCDAPYLLGHCSTCGADLRTPEQYESDLQKEAADAIARYTELCGDRARALADLREDAPDLVAAWERAQIVRAA